MIQPKLDAVPVHDVIEGITRPGPKTPIITMSPGQWDMLLDVAYQDGWYLLEIDENEQPIAAYRKPQQ